jgi:hypothetical protein
MRCIYCLEDKSQDCFSGREHVLPQSFGKFDEQNLTLRGKVCDECNSFFANNLDNFLARDTYEGFLRFSHGVQDPKDYKHMGKRASLTASPLEGPFKNARMHFEYDETVHGMRSVLLEQIGFKLRDSEEYEFFLVKDFPKVEDFDPSKYDLTHERSFLTIEVSEETASRLLGSLNLVFRPKEEIRQHSEGNQKVEVAIESVLTEPVCRCLAKIAFNYLANWNATETMLSACFDDIRSYIRYGKGTRGMFLIPRDEAILGGEPSEGWRVLGHILTVFSVPQKGFVIGLVSLFNQMSYWILLARLPAPSDARLEKGHLFAIPSREVVELIPGHTTFASSSESP